MKNDTNTDTEKDSKASEVGCSDLFDDLLWRLKDIREDLMSTGVAGRSNYNCDEWSTPTVNLASAIKKIEDFKSN